MLPIVLRLDLFFSEVVILKIRVTAGQNGATCLKGAGLALRAGTRVAADQAFKFRNVDKLIGLAAQLVGDHWWLGLKR